LIFKIAIEINKKITDVPIYYLQSPILENIEKILGTVDVILKPEQKDTRIYQNLKNIIYNIPKIFGLMIFDDQKHYEKKK
jgi:hypothetical protein